MFRRFAVALLVTATISTGLAVAAPVAQADPSCHNTNPEGNDDRYDTTKRSKDAEGRVIQLRYNTDNRCAWGRIYGWSGDRIWVDRATPRDTSHWEGPWGTSSIYWGSSSQYTLQYDDAGYVMRACGGFDSGGQYRIFCTDWY